MNDDTVECIQYGVNTDKEVKVPEKRIEETDNVGETNMVEEIDKDVEETDDVGETNGVKDTDKDVEETDKDVEETDKDVEETDKDVEESDNVVEVTNKDVGETDNEIEETATEENPRGKYDCKTCKRKCRDNETLRRHLKIQREDQLL